MDLIGSLTQQLGIPAEQAQAVAGTVLGVVQGQVSADAGDDTARQVEAAIPELDGWRQSAAAALRETDAPVNEPGDFGGVLGALGGALGGGGLGGLLGAATGGSGGGVLGAAAGALGGQQAQDIVKVGGLIQKLGLDADKAMMAAPIVAKFLKERLGEGLFGTLLKAAPLLGLTGDAPDDAPSAGGGIAGALGGLFG